MTCHIDDARYHLTRALDALAEHNTRLQPDLDCDILEILIGRMSRDLDHHLHRTHEVADRLHHALQEFETLADNFNGDPWRTYYRTLHESHMAALRNRDLAEALHQDLRQLADYMHGRCIKPNTGEQHG